MDKALVPGLTSETKAFFYLKSEKYFHIIQKYWSLFSVSRLLHFKDVLYFH